MQARARFQTLKPIVKAYDARGVNHRELEASPSLYMNMEPQLGKRDAVNARKEDLTAKNVLHNIALRDQHNYLNLTTII